MKRTFTQKVKQVPTCAADSFEALFKLYLGKHSVGTANPTEANRRARTSAAMIGLAISMGASGLLLPQQGDEALAVEPIATEPTLTTLPNESSASVSPSPAAESETVTVSKPPKVVEQKASENVAPTLPSVVKHEVKKGETLWQLAKTYEIQPEAIAASNNIEPSAILPVGQKLKIPSVNGIVHEVKAGETVETLSKSYGVEPTQLQAFASVSEVSQLQAGESVTLPGKVDDLLKARQDVALNNLKEKQNRLNDSLAEWRSEESTNLTELAAVPRSASATAESSDSVTLPPAVLEPEKPGANSSKPVVSVPTSPVVIPVPTPSIAATPTIKLDAVGSQAPIVIPVPTPEIAATPTIKLNEVESQSPAIIPVPTPSIAATPTTKPDSVALPAPVVIPVPTPSIAATPTTKPDSVALPAPVVIPVPTPSIAATPAPKPDSVTIPNLRLDSLTSSETAAKPQTPQPVVIDTLVAARPEDFYQVKPGDTLDAIARRYGLSRSELIQANRLRNPNLIRVNQQLTIPKTQLSGNTNETVALIPGIDTRSSRSTPGLNRRDTASPALAVPTLTQATEDSRSQANSTVVAEARQSQDADSQSNPHAERLRAEVLRMREEYRQQRQNGQANASRDIAVPAVTDTDARRSNGSPEASRVNPEFNPRRYNETAEAEFEQRQAQKGPIEIEVPPPENPVTPSRNLVAAAPAPAESYNPMLQTPVGQTVSPELPPLSAPDMYLPDSPAKFNGYIWPAKGVLTSGYGRRWGRMHRGIDIAAPIGTPIVAAGPGVVVTAGWNSGGYGNLVEIQHPDGSLTLYAHNNRILVRRGQEVAQGQQISEMGSTGYSTGPHLHFEVHPSGRGAVNPIAYLPPK